MLGRFFDALAWTATGAAIVALVAVLVIRAFSLHLPRPLTSLGALVLAAIVAALIRAYWQRPGEREAALAIDQRLGLKEKFSTALFMRASHDPFAQASVRDAEQTADNVSLHKRFPLNWPRHWFYSLAVALLAISALWWMPALDLAGTAEARQQQAQADAGLEKSRQVLREALVQIDAMPKTETTEEAIRNARQNLDAILKTPPKDPDSARRTALQALQDVNEAMKEEVRKNQAFAQAAKNEQLLGGLMPSPSDRGPVSDAQRALAQGDYSEAVKKLQQSVEQFKPYIDQGGVTPSTAFLNCIGRYDGHGEVEI
jgi:hypothetical protein